MDNPKPAARRLDGPARGRRHGRKPAQPLPTSKPKADALTTIEQVDADGNLVGTDAPKEALGILLAQPLAPTSGSKPTALKPKAGWRRHFSRKRVVIAVAVLLLALLGTLGVKAVLASQRIITKNSGGGAPVLAGAVDPTKLKGEGDGRINILLLGIGGSGHDGGQLSDTMMVASIDPVNKTVAMLSIPRDLYVKVPGYGATKINAANAYGGPDLAKTVVGRILDLPIHYYVQLDFSGFKQAVDSVGGVDIKNTEKLYDPDYPCDNDRGYCSFNLPVGQYHMDGKMALKFARCRHGSCGNDFGRAARQQQLLIALRQKSLQASTLSNPVKLAGLIDSIGNHVRTDMQLNETEKMASIIKDLDATKATSKVLDNTAEGLLVDGSGQFPGAGSILIPKAGPFDYSDIQELAHSIFADAYLKQENAGVAIQNGTLRGGLGAAVAKQLKAYGYNISSVGTADTQNHATSTIIDYSGGKKPYTVKYLQNRFKANVLVETRPSNSSATPQPDIVIIVGNNYKPTTQ